MKRKRDHQLKVSLLLLLFPIPLTLMEAIFRSDRFEGCYCMLRKDDSAELRFYILT